MIDVVVLDDFVTVDIYQDEIVVENDGYAIIETSEQYDGEHIFTPTASTQVVPIAGKTSLQDIVINPIPNNYGLITYDGFGITVS